MSGTVLRHRHVVSVADMDQDWIRTVFALATRIKWAFNCGPDSPEWQQFSKLLENRMMFALFYEASTRTRFSFEAAMKYLGGLVTTTEAARLFSSAAKGESLPDTIHTNARYGKNRSVIVLRHHEEGSARTAQMLDVCPIINAGDGVGEHPSQAMLDALTIREHFPDGSGRTLTLVGDLKHGRTVHSLCVLAIKLGAVERFQLISPKGLEMPERYLQAIINAGLSYTTGKRLTIEAIARSDVIYMTRVQKERMAEGTKINGDAYAFPVSSARYLKRSALIMHPLPRNDELPASIDDLPQAKYFDQVENGLYIRMALLLWVFDKIPPE